MLNILQNGQNRNIGLISSAADCARESEEPGQARPPHFQSRRCRVGVNVANVLHVGYDSALDALGALHSGMHAAWLNREGKDWPHVSDYKP